MPSSAPSPIVTANGDGFELKPELITKGEIIRIALLTEGRAGNIDVKFKPFGDVDVEVRDREAWIAQRSRRRTVAATTGVAVLSILTILVIVFGLIASSQANKNLAQSQKLIIYAACSSLLEGTSNTALTIDAATTAIVRSKIDGKDVFSFPATYQRFVSDARRQINDLFDAYDRAKRAGVSLGNATKVRAQAAQGITLLEKLPKERNITIILSDINSLLKIGDTLSSNQAIPTACP